MDMRTFTQSVLLSWRALFSEMTDREQKAVLEDIPQIDMLYKAQAIVKRRLTESQSKLSQGSRTKLVWLTGQIEAVVL